MMRRTFTLLAGLLLLPQLNPAAIADPPATQPAATAPSATDPIEKYLTDLASPDPEKRDQAQTHLMGLTRDQLPMLLARIEKDRPLAPSQVGALHDIVVHVFLTGETYPSNGNTGFMGLRWTTDAQLRFDEPARIGVPVEIRLPGFPSYQMLRKGDLILGVLVNPDAPLQQVPNMTTPTMIILQNAIQQAGADRDVVLVVLRQGQTIRVPIRLLRPPALTPDVIDQFSTARLQKAEEYWKSQFAKAVQANAS